MPMQSSRCKARPRARALAVVALGLLAPPTCCGMIHNLGVHDDARRVFQIESFGFRERGFMNLTVSGFSVEGPQPYRSGFVVKRTGTESSAQEEVENALAVGRPGSAAGSGDGGEPTCLLDKAGPGDLVLELSDKTAWEHGSQASRTVGPGEKGLYVLLYCGCPVESEGGGVVVMAEEEHKVSFKLRVAFWNEGIGGDRDYLSAGSESLPELFLGTFVLFSAALVVWARCIRRHPSQVLNNIAQIVLEETAPGSTVWLKWRNVLYVVDILCCCFILVPIIWSIRNLRDASLADSKAIRRLNVFTGFYKMVLGYIYFTRIILVLFSAMLPFELVWLEQLGSELATLIFFVITGWCFRPHPDAPYLPVGRDDTEGGVGSGEEDSESMELLALRRA
ncbi:Related to G-protein coupled receptors [Ectocarpus siliculosus]|uniref:Related to G-protein coupled receptors n=1 Tax=Ectocarpus siliculosus TaxID=2880 RepID=D8LNF1_ECTSI|nr:Related to G-protein coupled receptors [Ectocarpus siliculosus]|eukprot:CBN77308.1 Related to G-protein coupled receptors [Ectocarpus siliculosus]